MAEGCKWRSLGRVMVTMLMVMVSLPRPLVAQTCNSSSSSCTSTSSDGITLVTLDWQYIAGPMIAVLFILIVLVVGLALHYLPWTTRVLPETWRDRLHMWQECYMVINTRVLILLGLGVAAILYATGSLDRIATLSARGFLLFILPPIVLDAAYALNSRIFAENIILILTHAVLGTLVNFAIIGPSLYGLALTGIMGNINLSFLDALLFASFIVAVDPVAVIAIFKDVGVNERLYFLVFGESLLNDAITLVLYNMMTQFILLPSVPPTQIAMGVALFLVDSFGGFAIGLALGLLSALITRVTHKLPSVEPLILLILAYISYLLCQLFDWSSIIALTTCGIVQAQLCFPNIAYHSYQSIISMASILGYITILSLSIKSAFEAVVFLFLGAELMRSGTFQWNVVFIVMTIVMCLVARAVSIFGLTGLANCVRKLEKISYREQLIMWFGGLRGALAFALCSTLDPTYALRTVFLPATLVVIMFTVFLQGTLMRPLVKCCKIKMRSKEDTKLLQVIGTEVSDQMTTAVELIIDQRDIHFIMSQLYKAMNAVKRTVTHYSTQSMNLIELLETSGYQRVCDIRSRKHRTICDVLNIRCCNTSSNAVHVHETSMELSAVVTVNDDTVATHNGEEPHLNGDAIHDEKIDGDCVNDDPTSLATSSSTSLAGDVIDHDQH